MSRWRQPPVPRHEVNKPRQGRWNMRGESWVKIPSPLPGLMLGIDPTGGLRHRLISFGPPGQKAIGGYDIFEKTIGMRLGYLIFPGALLLRGDPENM